MKHSLTAIIILTLLISNLPAAYVSGMVTDPRGAPLFNAYVLLKNSQQGTTTDEAGRFTISVASPEKAFLTVRYLGCKPTELNLSATKLSDLRIIMQPEDCHLAAITVTASRSEKHLDNIARKVEVLPRREIEQSGNYDVAEVLENNFSSLQIEKNGYNRGSVKLQGLPAEYTLVLIDGEKAKGGTGTQAVDIGQIPLDIVERVEVIKGPTSSLYGSDALGGVVNIITKKPENKPEIRATYGLASEYTNTASLQGGIKFAQTGLFASWSRFYTEGENLPDKFQSDNLFGKLSYSDYFTQTVNYYKSKRNLEEMQEDKISTKSSLAYPIKRNADLTASVAYSTYSRQLGSIKNRRKSNEYSWKYSLLNEIRFSKEHELVTGVDYYNNEYNSNIITGKDHSAGLFMQYDSRWLADLTVTTGLRLDRQVDWGTELNPSLAVMYSSNEKYRLRAGAGTGFKAPSLSELNSFWCHPNGGGFWIKGNSDLKPEKSFGTNINLELTPVERFNTNIGLFYNRVKNMIITDQSGEFHTDGKQLYTYRNCDKITTAGLEYEAKIAIFNECNLSVSYTWLTTKNLGNNKELTASPRHKINSSLDYTLCLGRYEVTTTFKARYSTAQFLDSENLTSAREFWLADSKISCKTPYGFNFSLGVENLLNKKYRIYDQMPARFFTGQIAYNY